MVTSHLLHPMTIIYLIPGRSVFLTPDGDWSVGYWEEGCCYPVGKAPPPRPASFLFLKGLCCAMCLNHLTPLLGHSRDSGVHCIAGGVMRSLSFMWPPDTGQGLAEHPCSWNTAVPWIGGHCADVIQIAQCRGEERKPRRRSQRAGWSRALTPVLSPPCGKAGSELQGVDLGSGRVVVRKRSLLRLWCVLPGVQAEGWWLSVVVAAASALPGTAGRRSRCLPAAPRGQAAWGDSRQLSFCILVLKSFPQENLRLCITVFAQ